MAIQRSLPATCMAEFSVMVSFHKTYAGLRRSKGSWTQNVKEVTEKELSSRVTKLLQEGTHGELY